MGIYNDLEESLLKEFKSSTKQSIDDIALDQEEKDKVILNVSGSKLPELRVDYSNFANHVFFGSAYSAVNYAYQRVFEYPFDGQLRDVIQWKELNNGYENWFFDNFPKDHAYLDLTSNCGVHVKDHENKVNFGTGSFTIECIVDTPKPNEGQLNSIFSYYLDDQNFIVLYFTNRDVFGNVGLYSVIFSASTQKIIEVPYDSYIGKPRHVAFSYENDSNLCSFYIDGEFIASESLGFTGSFDFGTKDVWIGNFTFAGANNYFTGAIDEVRVWNTLRSEENLKRNYFKTIHANTGSLQLYYKFDEPWLSSSSQNQVIDYSGNRLDGTFSGSFDSENYKSGSLASWFKDDGVPILQGTNNRVIQFITEQQNSGSAYDASNPNYIFELVPSFMIDDPASDDQKKFLLLLARHWDRLKLYIQHLAYVHKTNLSSNNDIPDDYLNLIGKDYGIDIGSIYSNSDPLQYFYGENVLSSGSLDFSVKDIGNQLKRNILNNLCYLYKTKSTREAIKSALHTLGLDDSIVSINEYSELSGGIQTTFEPKTVERKVLSYDGSPGQFITLHSSSYSPVSSRSYEFRFSLLSSSYAANNQLTTSIFRIEAPNSGSMVMECSVIRENVSSSNGFVQLRHSGSTAILSSSVFEIFENNWVYVNLSRNVGTFKIMRLNVYKFENDEIFNVANNSAIISNIAFYNPPSASVRFGSTATQPFYGKLHEVRVWNGTSVPNEQLHAKDFESVALDDFINDIDSEKLMVHLKLDDFTGSISGNGPLHDYVDGKSGSSYSGFSSSSNYNFTGEYIKKLEPSYNYDFAINNDKIRLKDLTGSFKKSDINRDIPFLSIDFSPINVLNKEIVKWFGSIEKFSDIIGYPYLKYRDEITELNAYRYKFFNNRVVRSINYSVYFDIIKWFDSNFSYFLSQLVPLDVVSSLSNFVIEPNLFEFNKIKQVFPYSDQKDSYVISGAVSATSVLTASSDAFEIALADPGRFGSALSCSGEVFTDTNIVYPFSGATSLSSSPGLNYSNASERKLLNDLMQGSDINPSLQGYGNGFYVVDISCSNYLKNVLNVITDFHISGVNYTGGSPTQTNYLSSSEGAPRNVNFTGGINAVQDARWLWYRHNPQINAPDGPKYDFGLGYGGGFGQLWSIANKSIYGGHPRLDFALNHVGNRSRFNRAIPDKFVEVYLGEEDMTKTVILWPTTNSHNGVTIYTAQSLALFEDGSSTLVFGEPVNIEGYNYLAFQIIGNSSLPYAATKNLSIRVEFQFFDKEVGESGFEKILSSSFSAGSFVTTNTGHYYVLNPSFGTSNDNVSFIEQFERELPKNKYMRVRLAISTAGSDAGTYNILVKGKLSKDKLNSDILKQRV